ncbi:MAG: cysteine hydrolase [Pseudomonadota bacterium]|nr:cysteine hydrolase [Pseudomonadota bacterium]
MTEWLMVIDLQPAFAHPDSPWFTPTLDAVTVQIERLVRRFGTQVVFTRFVPPDAPWGSWRQYYEQASWALQHGAAPLWDLEARWAGRASIGKHTFSKWGPEVRQFIGVDDVAVLCGVSTECCVLMTALAAVDDGAHVRVVADACASKSTDAHRQALAVMGGRAPQLRITTAAEELAA